MHHLLKVWSYMITMDLYSNSLAMSLIMYIITASGVSTEMRKFFSISFKFLHPELSCLGFEKLDVLKLGTPIFLARRLHCKHP